VVKLAVEDAPGEPQAPVVTSGPLPVSLGPVRLKRALPLDKAGVSGRAGSAMRLSRAVARPTTPSAEAAVNDDVRPRQSSRPWLSGKIKAGAWRSDHWPWPVCIVVKVDNMSDQPQLSEVALDLLRLHCSGHRPEADHDHETNEAYKQLVRAGLMQVARGVANGEGSPRTYEPTDKGRQWYSVLGMRNRTKRRRRGVWGFFRLRS
jgi:hypothetical protein